MGARAYGWRLEKSPTLMGFSRKCHAIRERLVPEVESCLTVAVAKRMVDEVARSLASDAWADGTEGKRSLVGVAADDISNARKRLANRERVPEYDVEMSLCVLPLESGAALVMPFCERGAWKDLARDALGGVEWGWSDGVDCSEGVSHAEWERRGAEWREALCGFDLAPSEAGNVIVVVPHMYSQWWFPERGDVARAILSDSELSRESMARRLARDMDFSSYLRGMGKEWSVSAYMGWRDDVEEGLRDIESIVGKVLPLMPELGADILDKSVEDIYREMSGRREALAQMREMDAEVPKARAGKGRSPGV